MNIFVYAISCRNSGALSVLNDFFTEVCKDQEKYPDIHWFFLLSTQVLECKDNIDVFNYPNSVRSWAHRWVFSNITLRKLLIKYQPSAVVSLQNMMPKSVHSLKVISLHNVLPLYRCDKNVHDTVLQRVKQIIVNAEIVKSLKRADAVFVPSAWIRDALHTKLKLDEKSIYISPLKIPEVNILNNTEKCDSQQKKNKKNNLFFYPATGYPYKNHQVIIEACKLLKDEGITDYRILFTIEPNQSKTAHHLYKQTIEHGLKIDFVGNQPRERVAALYNEGILLFPSKIETDAMPLIEAKQLNGDIISADLPYAHSVLSDYHSNIYFDPDDSIALKNAMIRIMCNLNKAQDNCILEVNECDESISRIETIIQIVKSDRK